MDTAVGLERKMVVEDRIASLESDMKHVLSDSDEMKASIRSVEGRLDTLEGKVQDVRIELHSFRTEVTEKFGELRTEMSSAIGGLRTEMADKIGGLRTEMTDKIGGLRTEMIDKIGQLKVWMLLTGVGAVGSLVSMILSIVSFVHGWKSP